MQLSNILHLALLAASQTLAAPVTEPGTQLENGANELIKRADPAPVSCGSGTNIRAWPLQSVQEAYDALVASDRLSRQDKPMAGTRAYPRQYGGTNASPNDQAVVQALDAIPECATGQNGKKFFEFPITSPAFAGQNPAGDQGPDRVVAIAPNAGQGQVRQFTYCLAMTHRGGAGGSDPSFRPCT